MLADELFKGYKFEDLKKMEVKDFIALIPSRQRRSVKRGFTDQQKKLMDKIKKAFTDVPSIPVSSSEIRQRIEDKDFLKKHLPEKVFQYIKEKNLYVRQ